MICPRCNKEHEDYELDEDEEHDDLCLSCEIEWIRSQEYSFELLSLTLQ